MARPTTAKKAAIAPRKQPNQARSRATVEAILQATAYILVRDGYDAMTTNQIAAKAGVNIASLYQYFPNKQALVAELMQRHVDEMRAASMAAWVRESEQSPEGRIRALIAVAAATHAVNPRLHEAFTQLGPRLGFRRMHSEADAVIAAASQRWIDRMRDSLPDPALALWIARTAVHAVMHLAFVERKDVAASPLLVDELVRLIAPFLHGARRPAARRRRSKKSGGAR